MRSPISFDLTLHLAHLPFGNRSRSPRADEGVKCLHHAGQIHPQASRVGRQDGEVFEHKGSHRSLSLSFSEASLASVLVMCAVPHRNSIGKSGLDYKQVIKIEICDRA